MKIKVTTDNYRSLSQIFAPSTFKKILRNKNLELINYKIQKHIKDFELNDYHSVLNFLYKNLEINYRNEYIYKNALLNKKLLGTYSLNTTTVLNEFKIGGSIADFILLNGEVKLFEIKTDLDSFDKLAKQIIDYKKFANKVYVVVSTKNVSKLIETYNNTNIGVIEFTNHNTLRTIIEAQSDSSNFDHNTIFKTLRKNEYLELLVEYFGYLPDVPNTQIFKESLKLAKLIDVEEFQSLAFKKLKNRKLKCPEILESEITPKELKHICYTLDLSKKEYDNLFEFLNKKI